MLSIFKYYAFKEKKEVIAQNTQSYTRVRSKHTHSLALNLLKFVDHCY